MADIVPVHNEQSFHDYMDSLDEEYNPLDQDGQDDLWEIWSDRYELGSSSNVLLALPEWWVLDEIGPRRPFMFGTVEYDEPSKGAVLFDDLMMVDISVLENGVYDDLPLSDCLERLDVSDESDFIDEPGMIWIPRKLMNIMERED